MTASASPGTFMPHMTVAGNIAWPLKVARWPRERRDRRVKEVLALLGIGALAERYPAEISGGQQQRVAIARTIAPEPSILLAALSSRDIGAAARPASQRDRFRALEERAINGHLG